MLADTAPQVLTEVHRVLLPADDIYQRRAERYFALAKNHALSDWLNFLGHLCLLQQALYASLPTPKALEGESKRVALDEDWLSTLPWPDILRSLLAEASTLATAEPLAAAIQTLRQASPSKLQEIAYGVLNNTLEDESAEATPAEQTLVAAALQVCASHYARTAINVEIEPHQQRCPCCGGAPLGSIIHSDSKLGQGRYLQCSICATRWHATRARCTSCDAEREVTYQYIEGSSDAVRAECCDACHSYLKLYLQEKDAAIEPDADDLATLELDVLIGEQGYARSGPNLFLVSG